MHDHIHVSPDRERPPARHHPNAHRLSAGGNGHCPADGTLPPRWTAHLADADLPSTSRTTPASATGIPAEVRTEVGFQVALIVDCQEHSWNCGHVVMMSP
jgi:hypothetical protein